MKGILLVGLRPMLLAAALLLLAVWPAPSPTAAESQSLPSAAARPWFPFVVPSLYEAGDAAVDLSFLNPEPAGSHGFLKPEGEQLVDQRGRVIRLFGANICAQQVMPAKQNASKIARRLKQLGINCVRLHAFDEAAAPRGIFKTNLQRLDPVQLDRLDWLVFQLKQNGIYIDLNLHVGRPYADLPSYWHPFAKAINRIHRPYLAYQKNYARDLLTHVNPYTGRAYANEPAIAIIELNNENTVLMKPVEIWAHLPPRFSEPLRRYWNRWLAEKYTDTNALNMAWRLRPALSPNDLLSRQMVPLPRDRRSLPRLLDWTAFLLQRELAFSVALRDYLIDDLGARSMIIDTQANYGGKAGLLREKQISDMIDIHVYPQHPRWVEDSGKLVWKTRHRSMLDTAFGPLEHTARWRLADRPFGVTEFDLNVPNDFNAEALPLFAVMASYQGWSTLLKYAWFDGQSDATLTRGLDQLAHPFHTAGNPVQMVTIPVAALLHRLALVAPGQERIVLDLPRSPAMTPAYLDRWWRGLPQWYRLGLRDIHAWHRQLAVRIVDTNRAQLSVQPPILKDDALLFSDTGEISLDRRQKGRQRLMVTAPAVRMAVGRFGEETLDLGDVQLALSGRTRHGFACIALVSLDGQPIDKAGKLLLTTVAGVGNQDWTRTEDEMGILDWGDGPTEVEHLSCRLRLPGDRWQAWALDGYGRSAAPAVMASLVPEAASVLDTATHETLWYLIVRD